MIDSVFSVNAITKHWRKIPDGLPDEKVIFTGNILSTGLTGVLRAHVKRRNTVAVFGSGPVGLCAVAWKPGRPGRVYHDPSG